MKMRRKWNLRRNIKSSQSPSNPGSFWEILICDKTARFAGRVKSEVEKEKNILNYSTFIQRKKNIRKAAIKINKLHTDQRTTERKREREKKKFGKGASERTRSCAKGIRNVNRKRDFRMKKT